jgi:hypothetical protein
MAAPVAAISVGERNAFQAEMAASCYPYFSSDTFSMSKNICVGLSW